MTLTTEPMRLAAACDDYLSKRTATYEQRCDRFEAAYNVMADRGLGDGDILLDFGAGATDFDRFLRGADFHGRYWPVDGWMGYDLQWWKPKRPVAWTACLEVIEHIPHSIALQVLDDMKEWSTKGVVLTTPNPDTVDVLAMDDTHLWSCYAHDLQRHGYHTEICSFYGTDDDSILAWWTP